MEEIGKDILAIIIVKIDCTDVLKLRLCNKSIKDIIDNYNKYWFFQLEKEKRRTIFIDCEGYTNTINSIDYIECDKHLKHKGFLSHGYKLPTIICANEDFLNYMKEMHTHPNYKEWTEKGEKLGLKQVKDHDFLFHFTLIKFLDEKFADGHKCKALHHYDLISNAYTLPGFLNDLYIKEKDYFTEFSTTMKI